MKFGEYYIVDVSFNKSNPIHRSIAVVENSNLFTLFNSGYEYPIKVLPEKDLFYFKVIDKIKNMKDIDIDRPEEQLIDYNGF